MRFQLTALLTIVLTLSAFSQKLISFEKLKSYSPAGLDSFVVDNLGVPPALLGLELDYPVDYYRVIYETPYGHPDSIVRAAGAVCMPKNVACGVPISSWGHGTTSNRSGGASSMNGHNWQIGPIFAGTGYLVCIPDYVGLGDYRDTSVKIHPYQHEFTQANTNVNILRAARQLADTLGIELNEEVFLFGYSQGGYVTAATHKLIETELSNEFQITASAPMAGSYDLTGVQTRELLSDSMYATPGYLPYLIYGWWHVYPDFRATYPDPHAVFRSPFDTIFPVVYFDDGDPNTNDDNKGIGFIDNILRANGAGVPKLMMKDSILQAFVNDSVNHPLRLILAENELVYGWVPEAPLRMYYCEEDEQVPFENALVAYDVWTNAGATNVSKQRMDTDASPLMHTPCAQPALIAAKLYFDSLRTVCTGIAENILENRVSIYPNPSVNSVSIRLLDYENTNVLVTDLTGREVIQLSLSQETTELGISNWAKGIYFFRFENELGRTTKKFIKN